MKRLRKIFRNPASDLLLVLGLVISCIILINIADLVSKISVETSTRQAYTHTLRISIFGDCGEEQTKYMTEYFDNLNEGNVYLTKSVHIDKQRDGKYAYVLMEDNEELLLDYKEGGYSKGSDYKNAVIIGESLEKYIIVEDGKKYLDIDNERYNVIGILENNMSAGIDTSVYILWDTMDAGIKNEWMSQDLVFNEIYYESNISGGLFYDEFSTGAAEYGIELDDMGAARNEVDYQNEWYKVTNKLLLSVGLVFSVFTCFSVSYLWLLNRRKELAVRMSYGYSGWQIFKLLFTDTLRLMIPAFFISVIVQLIYGIFLDKAVLSGEMFLLRICVVFAGIFVIVMVNTLYLMRKLQGFSAVMINEEK